MEQKILTADNLSKTWWRELKPHYIFDKKWFEPFKALDSRLVIPDPLPDGKPNLGKLGVVFWHQEDGKKLLPVGVTYCDGNEFVFCYHPDYASNPDTKEISRTLPKSQLVYKYQIPTYEGGKKLSLMPYFDNLVSEGWLGMMQRNACHLLEGDHHVIKNRGEFEEKDSAIERYKRMLMFGRGFHGAISVVDAVASDEILIAEENTVHESLVSKATVGGAQPKLLAVRYNGHFRASNRNEPSTHIAKLPIPQFYDIIFSEYLNIVATRKFLPQDTTVEAEINVLDNDPSKQALFIKRFDRTEQGGRRHFEEALQIKGDPAIKQYFQPYHELAKVGRDLMGEEGAERLFKRVLTQFLLGNSDGHFKNFAFWKTAEGKWDLTPNYDLVSNVRLKRIRGNADDGSHAAGYVIPLKINGRIMELRELNPKRILMLGKEFGLKPAKVKEIVDELRSHVADVKEAIRNDDCQWVTKEQREKFCHDLDGRLQSQLGTFDKYYAISSGKNGATIGLG
jgi:HipA-like protein